MSRGPSRGFVGGPGSFGAGRDGSQCPSVGVLRGTQLSPTPLRGRWQRKTGFVNSCALMGAVQPWTGGSACPPCDRSQDGFGKPPSVVPDPASAPWAPGLRACTHCLMGNLLGRRAQARSGQQVNGLPGPAFDEGGLTSCQFGSVRRPSVHSPFQSPKDASETQIRGITPLPHTFYGSPLVGEKS